ncbi:hypothetical protein PVBG_04805 [Plasmodium vivax Brazil I]|uniref:Uncharacterized protein n=1 Tax=Plasmodium vivax (strain Brazil I) TaxID=1033975 RepID=A0A0J9T0P0_PLAV1|nr:hypothetical protein PVBG_04805 [Plasmodium vivax Brazil I]
MSEYSLNIRQLRKLYPVLHEIWDIYEEFDENVYRNRENTSDAIACDAITETLNNDKENYHNICMKLAKNLKKICNNKQHCKPNPERCFNLNNWIYNLIKSKNLDIEIIKLIFHSNMYFLYGSNYENICPFYSYDEIYKDPIKMIMLNIFHTNMNIIRKILLGNIDSIHCSCQKYVNEGVKIYKHMKNAYCSRDKAFENDKTCKELEKFMFSYNEYLYNDVGIRKKIPSLEDGNPVKLLGCDSDEATQETEYSETSQALQQPVKIHTSQDTETNNSKSSLSPTVSTALGTMAGASSIIALLYKVHTTFHLNI